MNLGKIYKLFHFFNIHADIDFGYGKCAVSKDSDEANCQISIRNPCYPLKGMQTVWIIMRTKD